MRLKSELYKKEQDEIVDNIISILDLENKTEYTLYELDKNALLIFLALSVPFLQVLKSSRV
jgi:L-rhamnose mutarotase